MRVARRFGAVLTTGLVVAAMTVPAGTTAGASLPDRPETVAGTNPEPAVVPALQTWTGGRGDLTLRPSSRIVVLDDGLDDVATQLRADVAELTHLRPRIVTSRPRAGDIVLDLDGDADVGPGGDAVAAREGYRLDVQDRVRIVSRTDTGVFWGTRTMLQMMAERFPERGVLPVGEAVDWPNVAVRGFMLDVGRRWFGETYVQDMARVMSWYKLNTFQVHLNDNEIFPENDDWSTAQSAFRLASDDPELAGLAAEDGSFTRAEWDELEDVAAAHHVTVVPEIDSPAHSRAFIEFDPSLGLDGGDSDHLDLSKPETTAFMKDVFTEFTPWFRSPTVHIGLDEYPRELEPDYREYANALAAHVRSLGKDVRAWGSLSVMAGGADGYDKDVEMVSWNNGWYGGRTAIDDGYPVVNANDATLYIVPFADYYHGHGLDGRWLYDQWEPHVFGGGQDVDPDDPLLLGAMSAVWNDLVHEDYDGQDVYGLVEPTFGLLAHRMWRGPVAGLAYDDFMGRVERLGVGPGVDELTTTLLDPGDLGLPVTLSAPRVVGEGDDVTVTATIRNTGTIPVSLRETTLAVDGAEPLVGDARPERLAPGGSTERTWTFAAGADKASFTVTATGKRGRNDTSASARSSVAVVEAAPPGTVHLSFDGVATASSVEGGLDRLDARHVNDGDLGTRWASDYSDDQWVQVELAQPSDVSAVRLFWEEACAERFVVQTSVDGETWTDSATVDESTCATDDVELTASGPVSFVRVQGVERATSYGYSLHELWVFGNPA
ncbi:hypothetical protein GCM10009809_14450 [Isoptericola hypogeus]|uniref:F5/8 type C domain-containing protein n=1 Tax=Isoptericola hypogeus TaxID=300179 RepID=A0ABP4VCS2_9MICO